MKLLQIIATKMNDLQFPKFLINLVFAGVVSAASAVPVSLMDLLFGWYIDNRVFLTLVFLAVAIDHILGSYVHLMIKKNFSPKKNVTGLLVKGFSVCAGYVLFEMIHQIMKDVDFVAIYFKVVLQLTVMIYPVYSALKNLSIINGGKFPPEIWFRKFEGFNKDLDITHFKTKKDEEVIHDSNDVPADAGVPKPEEGRTD